MKYSYYFEKKSDKIILIKLINIISSLSNYPDLNFNISYNIPKIKSLILPKDKKLKKTRKKTTTKKLLEEVTKKSKMNGDLKKT